MLKISFRSSRGSKLENQDHHWRQNHMKGINSDESEVPGRRWSGSWLEFSEKFKTSRVDSKECVMKSLKFNTVFGRCYGWEKFECFKKKKPSDSYTKGSFSGGEKFVLNNPMRRFKLFQIAVIRYLEKRSGEQRMNCAAKWNEGTLTEFFSDCAARTSCWSIKQSKESSILSNQTSLIGKTNSSLQMRWQNKERLHIAPAVRYEK